MLNKVIDTFSRIFVGALFIFSGLIKLNDPIGTKIKLEEYFGVFADDFGSFFEFFIPYALPIAVCLIVLEVVLGVAVLINYRMAKTTVVLLVLMVFFTFLTFYSAYFNKVTDCGCFGDAIPLDPWESFYKDVILMVFVLHLFWHRNRFKPIFDSRPGDVAVLATTIISIILGIYAIAHLPFIDFRPYKAGNSIPEEMVADESPVLQYTFVKNGEEVVSQKYLMPADGYEYVSSEVINEDESIPAITDYQIIGADGDDYTQETFTGSKLLIIFYDVKHADVDNMPDVSALVNGLKSIEPMVLTAAGESEFEEFRHEHQLAAPYYFADATVLKAMIRSNPGLMLVKNGTVLGKWHNNDVPRPELLQGLAN